MTLNITNLAVNYGPIVALVDITIAAEPGRVVALLGPNASGKSTLLRCAAGLHHADRGNITWNQKNIAQQSPKTRAHSITYLSQRTTPVRDFSVREVVEFGRFALPRDATKIQHAMARAEVDHLATRRMQELSGGQQQRVAIARALAQVSPDGCLILDEPTAALDLAHVRMMIGILRELRAQGVCILIALHDLALAESIADDVWLLDGGRLAAAGPKSEVLRPDVLEPVFHVNFARAELTDGRSMLVPGLDAGIDSGDSPRPTAGA